MERHEETFEGFRLVASLWKGKFQGRAWLLVDQSEQIRVINSSLENVIAELRNWVCDRNVKRRYDIHARHIEYLSSISRSDSGRVKAAREDLWKCYACHSVFHAGCEFECVGCGWSVCVNCSHCGCGYMGERNGRRR